MQVNNNAQLAAFNLQSVQKKPAQGAESRVGTFAHEIADIPLLPEYDPRSKDAVETMNKNLEKIFRVDGVIVAAFFEGNMSVSRVEGGTLANPDSASLADVQRMLENTYGSRLQVQNFDSSDSIKLINFERGDLFTDKDRRAGWQSKPVLSDAEFNTLVKNLLQPDTKSPLDSPFKAKA
ncbi:MAG: hypothetical protein OIF57_06960 [Marinobacterium sp.]|nr:hypothetical protein [Marinobacterium sp.]